MSRTSLIVVAAVLLLQPVNRLHAQGRGAGTPAAPPPPTAKAAAPFDLAGYWVSVITEDWRWRMVPAPKGDYASMPINPEGRKAADAWDPAKDEAAGEQCRAYGAAGIMRVPGRLRISWQDDNTLKVETDAGTQTRLFYFAPGKPPAAGRPTWQGESVATWEPRQAAAAAGNGIGATTASAPRFGNLKVVTRRMRPGYLRTNGIPYSADTVMTEYWNFYSRPNAEPWVVITTVIDDPKYLEQQYLTTPNFKREPDGSKWDPTPCSSRW